MPVVNASRLRSRAFWLRLPCRSTAGTPAAVSCLASFFAWCLVRVNSTLRPRPEASSLTIVALSAASTRNTWWVMVLTGATAGSTECVVGLLR